MAGDTEMIAARVPPISGVLAISAVTLAELQWLPRGDDRVSPP